MGDSLKAKFKKYSPSQPSYGTVDTVDTEDYEEQREEQTDHQLDQQLWWKVTHALGFFIGGSTFIVGTSCYFFPSWINGGLVASILYVIGSFGFLYVDVQEFFTYTEEKFLRINISLSAIGSLLYVIGSAGFIPAVFEITPLIGEYGFILGSFFIGTSQAWKTTRLYREDTKLSFETKTAIGVEANAGIGAWCFFFGTFMFKHGPLVGAYYETILIIWVFGSTFFTMGSLFLIYRHFVMGL